MAVPSPLGLWKFARTIERVFDLDDALRDRFAKLRQQIEGIEARLLKIETDQQVLSAEIRAAAMTAGSAAAALRTAVLARQIGVLQEQMRMLREATATNQRAIGAPGDPL
jgi:septal ring factor EnvC (AmiA/AmiB activator)